MSIKKNFDCNISFISENAFHFRCENDKTLVINLTNNILSALSFALNSLCNLKKSTKLDLRENKIEYLDEQVFKPFFDADQWNAIKINENNQYFDENCQANRWNQSFYSKTIIYTYSYFD